MNDSQTATRPASVRWAELGPQVTRVATSDSASVAEALEGLNVTAQLESFGQWLGFCKIAEVFDAALDADIAAGIDVTNDRRLFDTTIQVAARIAMSRAITQTAADRLLATALAMRDRLPLVGECLRDGLITGYLFQKVVSRTELVDAAHAAAVDADIAERFRTASGSWSVATVRNMADRIVFRHDPDAVRARRKAAVEDRSTWVITGEDGMATLGGSMTAENARIAHDAVKRLAATACKDDPRTKAARTSDAMFALLAGDQFTCDCDRADCDAQIPVAQQLADVHGRIVIHVIADASTVAGEADNPGFVDGHGVISGDQVKEIVARQDSTTRPLGPQTAPDGDEPEGDLLDPHLPSDPYRPSTALDVFLRIRDGYCTIPGCDRPAWGGDLDHVTEYDHDDPAAGGQTCPEDMNDKCRFHHLFKTYCDDWIDDQYTEENGHTRTEIRSPEGIVFPGPAENNEDLFGGLRYIKFGPPDTTDRTPPPPTHPPGEEPRRSRPRTAATHAWRREQRRRNRLLRERANGSRVEGLLAAYLDGLDAPPPY